MGTLFCSYFFENSITRLRKSILESKPDEIKQQLNGNKTLFLNKENLLNSEIDNDGNTPLLLSIELRKLECFRLLVNEYDIDLNKANSLTEYRPLHLLALSKPIFKIEKFERVANDAYKFRKESFTFSRSNIE